MSAYDLYDFIESAKIAGVMEHAIEKALAGWGYSPEGGGSWNGGFLLKLKNDSYAYIHGWCDYTGWGCQDGSEVHFFSEEPNKEALEKLSHEYFYAVEERIDWDEPINVNRYLNGEIDQWESDVG